VVQAITHALFDLAAKPEYLKPLREEVEELIKREGWTKAALEQMHKLDSFVKESQRLHPVGVCKLV
jgi:cytochrome P450